MPFRRSRSRSRRETPGRPPFRPRLESLEDRSLPSASGAGFGPSNPPHRDITVLSRNLYLGADLDPAVAAVASGDPAAIVQAVSQAWASVVANDFPARAEVLADEIAQARPLLVGLQEVSLFRTGEPDSLLGNPTQADQVEFDYLSILLGELSERGLHYRVVAVTEEFDFELPGFTADGLRDVRLTDRDVILARADLPPGRLRLANVQEENFVTNVTVPVGGTGGTFAVLRGWNSVDATVRGKTFRFINAHLEGESANPLVNQVQVAQALELLDGPADTR